MRILAAIHPPEATRAILECLGIPSRAAAGQVRWGVTYPARA